MGVESLWKFSSDYFHLTVKEASSAAENEEEGGGFRKKEKTSNCHLGESKSKQACKVSNGHQEGSRLPGTAGHELKMQPASEVCLSQAKSRHRMNKSHRVLWS